MLLSRRTLQKRIRVQFTAGARMQAKKLHKASARKEQAVPEIRIAQDIGT